LTMVLVLVVPWFVIGFVTGVVGVLLMFSGVVATVAVGSVSWTPPAFLLWALVTGGLTIVLTILKDVLFIAWSRRKLARGLREAAARVVVPVTTAAAQPVAPPVIARPAA
ncbi:MAG: hypothetical protein RMK20_15420, partial [Verrucomicrobiales bacterium]|nr:hypothetical protein [Verrucomicrobiales bacterium]